MHLPCNFAKLPRKRECGKQFARIWLDPRLRGDHRVPVARFGRELAAFAAQKGLVVGGELAELGALHDLGALYPGALALGEGLLARGGCN